MSTLPRLVALMISVYLSSSIAEAATIQVGPSTILSGSMISYSTVGNGDVVFELAQNPLASQCYGFWLRPSDAGFKTNLAILLSVIQTQTTLAVSAEDSTIWTGSVAKYCLVYALWL